MTYDAFIQSLKSSGKNYDLELVEKAYTIANASHEGQRRNTGEAYIEHPLAVAGILVDMGMDTASICAAILHDVVEDTDTTLEEIRKEFGDDIALLVDGVTKLGQIQFTSAEEEQNENLRKMLLAMSKDVRVMIVKLCDRLHNMRTADGWRPQKRRDKALEVMDIYAPIAHRLGMSAIKDELQDISLKILDPMGYEEVRQTIERGGDAQKFVDGIVAEVQKSLVDFGLKDAKVIGRVKSVYGVYRKLFIQNRDFEDIYDIYAIRVILNDVSECYNTLMLVHDMYRPIPSRFKDYISSPKANMYQSLHTSVIGKDGVPFEIQIRTWDMHYTAEYGVAAHWKYKIGILGSDNMEEKVAWVRQLLERETVSDDDGELLQSIKSDLVPDDIFVFTPKGDVINLPTGATVIDFAYAIHSAVGNRMIGAKVNGKMVQIDFKVSNGDIIEVTLGPKDKGPSRDWLNIVTTSEAKSKIRAWFKKEKRDENIAEGRQAFEKELRRSLITVPDERYDEFLLDLAKRQKMNSADDMFAAMGYGGMQVSKVIFKAKELYNKNYKPTEPERENADDTNVIKPDYHERQHNGNSVVVEGLDNCLIKFAKCCNPLPGDEIVGFITRGYGVSIHKAECVNAIAGAQDAENSQRWVKAHWAENIREDFKATIDIMAIENGDAFSEVSTVLKNMHVPIISMNARTTTDGRVSMELVIGIINTTHLSSVIQKLSKAKTVISVERV